MLVRGGIDRPQTGALSTPRISLVDPKVRVPARQLVLVMVCTGWGAGRVYGVGYGWVGSGRVLYRVPTLPPPDWYCQGPTTA